MGRSIPIQNIYFLLLYAWHRLPEGKSIDVTGIVSPDLPNLLMKVLLEGIKNLQRRGLDRGYLESDEDLVRPRGRMCLGDTISRGLLSRVQVACRTDDLSYDVLHNRIVKSTLEVLVRAEGIDATQRGAAWALLRSLPEITSIAVSPRDFSRIQLHANNALYGLLLRVCALVHEALLPQPGDGRYRFREIIAEPQTMGLIFQDFVRNFYRVEQTQFNVKSEQFDWPIGHGIGHGEQFMPSMNTDVSLYDGKRTIIIECKWTTATLQRRHNVERVHSDHLYQLSAYVRHHPRSVSNKTAVEGLLLYPLVDTPLDVLVSIDGQRIRARTIDLTKPWEKIHSELIKLIGDPAFGRQ
jgi:5-methylcytosine-specific restriction enzyme subunit McrC